MKREGCMHFSLFKAWMNLIIVSGSWYSMWWLYNTPFSFQICAISCVLCSTNVGRHFSLCIPPMLHYCQCEWLILDLCTRWTHTAHWRKTAQSVCGDDALWHAQWSLTYTKEAPSIPNVRCSQAVTSAVLLHKYTVKSVKSAEPEGVYRGACEWDVLLCFAISGGYCAGHIYARMTQCEVLVIAVYSPASATHFPQPQSNFQAINEENSLRCTTNYKYLKSLAV